MPKFRCEHIECPDIGKIHDIKITNYRINSQGDVVCSQAKCPTCKMDMEDISVFEGFPTIKKPFKDRSQNYYKKYNKLPNENSKYI